MDKSLNLQNFFEFIKNTSLSPEEFEELKLVYTEKKKLNRGEKTNKFIVSSIVDKPKVTSNISNFFRSMKCVDSWGKQERHGTSEPRAYRGVLTFKHLDGSEIKFSIVNSEWRITRDIIIDNKRYDFHRRRELLKSKFNWSDEDFDCLNQTLNRIFSNLSVYYLTEWSYNPRNDYEDAAGY